MNEWVWVVLLILLFYGLGTLLIDHYYKRKAQFVENLTEKVKEGSNGKSK